MSRPDLEPRLRQALAERAGRATTSPGAWAEIQRRRRRQRRGGLVAALAALALAVVVAVPLLMALTEHDQRMPPAPATRPPSTTAPAPTTTTAGTGPAPAPGPRASVMVSSVPDSAAALRAIGQQVPGTQLGAVRFSDALGDNLVVLSTLHERKPSALLLNDKADWVTLYAEQYVTKGGRTRLVRKVSDGVQDCTVDSVVEFSSRTPEVFDLDGDGVGEVLFSYRVGCVGDISPVDEKLLILEGGQKYIMRGQTYTSPGVGKDALGRLPQGTPDPGWSAWPAGTRALAEQRWDQVAIRE